MSIKITFKEARRELHTIAIPYCKVEYLTRYLTKYFYTSSKVWGWRCDYYLVKEGVFISTGYEPITSFKDEPQEKLYNIVIKANDKIKRLLQTWWNNKITDKQFRYRKNYIYNKLYKDILTCMTSYSFNDLFKPYK